MTRTGKYQRCVFALGAISVLAIIVTPPGQAQTYTVLHKFKGSPTDGANPGFGHLIGDPAGNLYGTTPFGGAANDGVVFKLDAAGLTVLYSFSGGADGSLPQAGLIRDSAGNLYGTAIAGGAAGFGVVFKLDTTGTETVLHSFSGVDGANPSSGLIRDSAGNFYGTTSSGGTSSSGVVFKLDSTGTETVLYSFTLGADGQDPLAGLIRDAAGNLYGTTEFGGASVSGVVFKLDATGSETVLHTFTGGADGATPEADLIRDSAGNLYGTTEFGGASGSGVVFKLDAAGTEKVLYTFTGGADGKGPRAGLIRDSSGNLYGTTEYGGASDSGVVFKLDVAGTETVLFSFTGGADGANPFGGLVSDAAGNLYGTTFSGGKSNLGVVFKLQP